MVSGSEDKKAILNILNSNNNEKVSTVKIPKKLVSELPELKNVAFESVLDDNNEFLKKLENKVFIEVNNNEIPKLEEKEQVLAEKAEIDLIFAKKSKNKQNLIENSKKAKNIQTDQFLTPGKIETATKRKRGKSAKINEEKEIKVRKVKKSFEKKRILRNLIKEESKRLYLSVLGCFERESLRINCTFTFGFNLAVLGQSNDAFYKLSREWLPKNLFLAVIFFVFAKLYYFCIFG